MTFVGGRFTRCPVGVITVLCVGFCPLPLRQLAFDTLVAVVDRLRTLPLLYRVNADVLVAALDMELRQLLDAVDADMTDTWLPFFCCCCWCCCRSCVPYVVCAPACTPAVRAICV